MELRKICEDTSDMGMWELDRKSTRLNSSHMA